MAHTLGAGEILAEVPTLMNENAYNENPFSLNHPFFAQRYTYNTKLLRKADTKTKESFRTLLSRSEYVCLINTSRFIGFFSGPLLTQRGGGAAFDSYM